MQLKEIYNKSRQKVRLTLNEAEFLINTPEKILPEFLNYADQLRRLNFGNKVTLCSIVNARSGHCSEDCSFCAQSGRHQTAIETYPLLDTAKILESARTAKQNGAVCFSIVTSGKGIGNKAEFAQILSTIRELKKLDLCISASLGILTPEQAFKLKEAGLEKYHHNLETAESFFPEICSTHNYRDRIQTVLYAKAAGLEVCCGGIFGLGETLRQRVELGLALRDLDVDSVPLNFLNPIQGTRIYGKTKPLSTAEMLTVIATYRFLLPDKALGVMAGRQVNLKEEQSKIFPAGASGMMIGNYLTTAGNDVELDLKMLSAANLEPAVYAKTV